MPSYTGQRPQFIQQALLHIGGGAATGFLVTTLIAWLMKHDAHYTARLESMRFRETGTLIGSCVGLLFRQLVYEAPEISWDAEGLTYSKSGDAQKVLWSNFDSFRFTSRWSSKRLMVDRKKGDPVSIDYRAFTEDQRDQLLAELGRHTPQALPHDPGH